MVMVVYWYLLYTVLFTSFVALSGSIIPAALHTALHTVKCTALQRYTHCPLYTTLCAVV